MTSRTIGEFEHLLLLTLLRLGEPAYGVTILGELEERTGRRASPGAIYTAMSRLQRRGLVSSFLGEPTAQRGGRRKRFYELSPAGREALAEREAELRALRTELSTES